MRNQRNRLEFTRDIQSSKLSQYGGVEYTALKLILEVLEVLLDIRDILKDRLPAD